MKEEVRHTWKDGKLYATLWVNAKGEHHEWWAITYQNPLKQPNTGKHRYIMGIWNSL